MELGRIGREINIGFIVWVLEGSRSLNSYANGGYA